MEQNLPEGAALSPLGQLRASLRLLEDLCTQGEVPRVGDLLGNGGAAPASVLPAVILALPFLTPVSLGLMTAPASAVICLCGLSLARNAQSAPLPRRFLDAPVPPRAISAMRKGLDRAHRWVLRVSRPRIHLLVAGRTGRLICGLGMIAGAMLLAIPIPFLPLTNTFPAIAIICIGLGWSERDGLITVAGFGALLLSLVTFIAIGATVWLAAGELTIG